MKKFMKKIVLAGILLMLVATVFVFSGAPTPKTTAPASNEKKQELISLAKQKYQQAKSDGQSMENGPCLGPIAVGWVADVVHNPRQAVDDQPVNQCSDYLTQKVSHFIELDTNGNFVRMQ